MSNFKLWQAIIVVIIIVAISYAYLGILEPIIKSQAILMDKYELEISELGRSVRIQSELISRLRESPPSPSRYVSFDKDRLLEYDITSIGDTGSMLPTMNENTKVLFAEQSVNIGDIIIYENGGSFWIHRIIGEDGGCWLLQGDANRYNNQIEYVPKDAIIYRVMGILY